MVYVPFLNVELPEPKLVVIIPNAVSALLGCTGKVLEYGKDVLYPPSEADLKAYERSFEAGIPREFDRIRKRYAEGKILDDEMFSSEMEDASFDWYRRMLRTSAIGATDEDTEDVAARKLGMRQPSLQAAVQAQCLEDAIAEAGGIDLEADLRASVEFHAMRTREDERQQRLEERLKRLSELRRRVRPTNRQALSTISNASGGLLAGVLVAKSAILLIRRIFRRRKPQQRSPASQRPRQASQQPAAIAVAVAQQRPQASAVAQQVVAARSQSAAQVQQQQRPQQQETTKAKNVDATDGLAARKPRAVKRR